MDGQWLWLAFFLGSAALGVSIVVALHFVEKALWRLDCQINRLNFLRPKQTDREPIEANDERYAE